MKKKLILALAFSLALAPMALAFSRVQQYEQEAPPQQDQQQPAFEPYTADQLDNMLAPIALYPDPLLAQVLVAATFTDQVDQAARWVRAYGQDGIDDQPWDVSVRAVAHYPTVLQMMDDNLDWTAAVGQAYVYQSTDVMMSIQRLREMANEQGNLQTTPQQEVVVDPGYIAIWPVGPYIYVPTYDPSLIFFQRAFYPGYSVGYISFGQGWLIGVWLNLDFNWMNRRVYYTGWSGGGWIARCRRYIRPSPFYMNARFRTIQVNRVVTERYVNFHGLANYRSVHPRANFDNRMRYRPGAPAAGPSNKIINRNVDIYDPNLNRFRGRAPQPRPAQRQQPSTVWRQVQPPVQQQERQAPTRQYQPPARQAQPPRMQQTQPSQRLAQRPQFAPPARQQEPPMARQPQAQSGPGAFGPGNSVFSPRQASRRGQESRRQENARPQQRSRPQPSRPQPPRQAPKHTPHSN